MNTVPLREAARAVVLDPHQRVLLLAYDEDGGFWATPGGSLEAGEDYPTAVLRELAEEIGAADVLLVAQIAERSQTHPVGGREVRQIEKYYLARIAASNIDPSRATQTDTIRTSRWWTLSELRATSETVYPLGLADLIADILSNGVPENPAVLG
ncbi:NUDIX hydrolase [Streptomyces sp. 8L]|uniref:NUDIX hydrolase n=1 Tax=Streptomyces sp. 8L TaxID=2877242 RepID=UPI001CD8144C|nr:NUDIX domain-containing protein [Streptomyces sp. 8L]MCA1223395.1 NUDIX domain-containing protein [Streptomyces sp. 8L]